MTRMMLTSSDVLKTGVFPDLRDAACEELIRCVAPAPVELTVIETIDQLKELWEIDKAAYQDHSLEFGMFEAWWRRYPQGSHCLSVGGQIVASMGIYPIHDQAEEFAAGLIPEACLLPTPRERCDVEGARHWYFSGIVILPEHQNTGLALRLLRTAIGGWRSSGHIEFPCNYYGLAQTPIGRKALELFNLDLAVSGKELPDELDLYRGLDEDMNDIRRRFQGLQRGN